MSKKPVSPDFRRFFALEQKAEKIQAILSTTFVAYCRRAKEEKRNLPGFFTDWGLACPTANRKSSIFFQILASESKAIQSLFSIFRACEAEEKPFSFYDTRLLLVKRFGSEAQKQEVDPLAFLYDYPELLALAKSFKKDERSLDRKAFFKCLDKKVGELKRLKVA